MDLVVITLVTLIIARCLIQNIIKMLYKADNGICITQNYKGKEIVAIGGIVLIPVQLVAVLQLLLQRPEHSYVYPELYVPIIEYGFAGVIDDLAGDRRIKGFINHVRSTLMNNMTTGFLKALIGILSACIISLRAAGSLAELILNVLIITLYANTVNIFDMRPGRAVKFFLAMAALLLLSAEAGGGIPLIILILTVFLHMT